jgi:simple sugar transport system permease protein
MNGNLVLITDALVRATPLMITGLAVALAFRGGVFNIGAEGQLIVGAIASTAVTLGLQSALGHFVLIPALAAGALAGAAWAAIAAELKRRFNVLEIISTIMLNFIAIHSLSLLVRGPLQEPTRIYPQTETILATSRLPHLIPGTRLHIGFGVAVLIACLMSWFFRKTAAGFRVRAMGASPSAARAAGRVDVGRLAFLVFLGSGALSGIAGSIEVSGVTFALYENLSPGYGYTAIAVALIAGLNPVAIIVSSIFFGALETGAIALQREFAVPSALASVVESLLILAVLAFAAVRHRPIMKSHAT